jgi:hypothetical protein
MKRSNRFTTQCDRLRAEVAEIGVEARGAKAVAEELGRAMVVIEKRLTLRENTHPTLIE